MSAENISAGSSFFFVCVLVNFRFHMRNQCITDHNSGVNVVAALDYNPTKYSARKINIERENKHRGHSGRSYGFSSKIAKHTTK